MLFPGSDTIPPRNFRTYNVIVLLDASSGSGNPAKSVKLAIDLALLNLHTQEVAGTSPLGGDDINLIYAYDNCSAVTHLDTSQMCICPDVLMKFAEGVGKASDRCGNCKIRERI